MKKFILLIALLTFSKNIQAQSTDLSLARAGEFVLGVYLFVDCDPVNPYDYVGKIDKFDIFESDRKDIEKIIEKAKKKNPFFNGMIFKKDFKHVELIKFVESEQRVAGFKIGDQVTYVRYGTPVKAKIMQLDDAKQRAVVEYTDANGEIKYDGIAIKELNKE